MKSTRISFLSSVVLAGLLGFLICPSPVKAAGAVITNIMLAPYLSIVSDLGTTNQIQYSEDLTHTNWTTLTNLLVTQSPYYFLDATTPGNQRFYRVIEIDFTAPTAAILSPTDNSFTAATSIAVSGTASDNIGVTSVTWANTTTSTSGTATGTTSWSIPSVTLAVGANTIQVTAHDAAGNASTSSITVTRDNTVPTVTILSPANNSFTAAATTAMSGTASDNIGVTSVTWANTTTSANGTATGTTSWSVPSIALNAGANTIRVVAHDAAGNVSLGASITVTRDNTGPTLNISSPANNSSTAATSVTVTGTALDGSGVSSVAVKNNTTGVTSTVTGTTSWSANVNLNSGANTIMVTTTDSVGNPTVASITVTRTP